MRLFGFRSLLGSITVVMVSADIPGLIDCLNEKGIALYHIIQKDPLTIRVEIDRCWYPMLRKHALREGASVRIESADGSYLHLKRYLKRPVLLFGILIVCILSLWLPTRILFVEVQGNGQIPTKYILEQANICGITFGANRRDVRSEKMKNRLLEAVPQLQWAGINTVGCKAIITVEERLFSPESQQEYCVGSIVAARDGIIESLTATKGTPLCNVGQAVIAGEVLISGYTDCGISIRATQAEGEVFAKTNREITVVVPTDYVQKGDISGIAKKFSVIIGKNRINLFKDSGIYGTTCVKMYKEYALTLPGGFMLPVVFAVEQWIYYDSSSIQTDSDDYIEMTKEFAQSYLCGQMLSGRVLDCTASFSHVDCALVFYGRFLCSEMIGRVRYEGITNGYG